MALVINGEFLVSVRSGWTVEPWYLGEGPGRSCGLRLGLLPLKGPQMHHWTSQGDGHPEEIVLSWAGAREGAVRSGWEEGTVGGWGGEREGCSRVTRPCHL